MDYLESLNIVKHVLDVNFTSRVEKFQSLLVKIGLFLLLERFH